MRSSMRVKIFSIVGAVAVAFILNVISDRLIDRKVDDNLHNIQQLYVPRMELGPELKKRFENLQRALQDAVLASDKDALTETQTLRGGFLHELSSSKIVDPELSRQLREAFEDYYLDAIKVSRRLIAQEKGEAIIEATKVMQAKANIVEEAMKSATGFDKQALTKAFSEIRKSRSDSSLLRFSVVSISFLFVLLMSIFISRNILRSMSELTAGFDRFGRGDFSHSIKIVSEDDLGQTARHANEMAEKLRRAADERKRADWFKSGLANLSEQLQGELEPSDIAFRVTKFLCTYLSIPFGVLYYRDENIFKPLGACGLNFSNVDESLLPVFQMGEGLVGKAAMQDDISVIEELPPQYWKIQSGAGQCLPQSIAFIPIHHAEIITSVLELAFVKPLSEDVKEFLISIREMISVALESGWSRKKTRDLLVETQRQTERLFKQEEELRSTNEELATQQEEIQQTNEELEEQTARLEKEKETLEALTRELTASREQVQIVAQEAQKASQYKSEFLANMSHELRTPLNSIMVLSQLMAENIEKNLNLLQVKNANTIYSAGKDLLNLINDILDLSKVEVGKLEIVPENISLKSVAENIERLFAPQMAGRPIQFSVEVSENIPNNFRTDPLRLEQVLKNLISNAIKFTEKGFVKVRFEKGKSSTATKDDSVVAISVEDSGIGIPEDKKSVIFEAFKQVDSSIARKYGGTGLGLAISLSLAKLLGGDIFLESHLGKGSKFTLLLSDLSESISRSEPSAHLSNSPAPLAQLKPFGEEPNYSFEDPAILIIEDDIKFASILSDRCRESGFAYYHAETGEDGLEYAKTNKPRAIILDLRLPGMDGLTILKTLRTDPQLSQIPIHVMSVEDREFDVMRFKASSFLKKPIALEDLDKVISSIGPHRHSAKKIVVIDMDDVETKILKSRFAEMGIEMKAIKSIEATKSVVSNETFDGVILGLKDMGRGTYEVLNYLSRKEILNETPLIICAEEKIVNEMRKQLEEVSDAIIISGKASIERLLDEVKIFLHRIDEKSSDAEKKARSIKIHNDVLIKKTILIVDDDVRNIYALRQVLQPTGLTVLQAQTGKQAIEMLEKEPHVDLVLMDIMMPEMDGIEAILHIRKNAKFANLPIIALTAKAMKKDREECIAAGASDYLSKPFDRNQLLSLLKIWIGYDRGYTAQA